jgi:Tfp pilus assembly protein PilF
MVAAAASFSEMAGWMALDAGARTAAHRHLRRAVTLARNSGDRQLTAQAYASVSHLARSTGKAEAALTYAREGLACLAAAPPCGWLEARLRVVAASALAACGRPVEAVAAMSAAEAATATPSAAPSPWLSPFDAASFAIEAARCFARVDDPGEAERRLRTAVSLRGVDRVRSRALAQLALVTVLVGRGQIAEACALVEDVLDRAGGLGSAVLWDQLRHVSVLLDRDRVESTVVSPLVGRVEAAVHEHAWIAATAAWYETGTGAGVADAR